MQTAQLGEPMGLTGLTCRSIHAKYSINSTRAHSVLWMQTESMNDSLHLKSPHNPHFPNSHTKDIGWCISELGSQAKA